MNNVATGFWIKEMGEVVRVNKKTLTGLYLVCLSGNLKYRVVIHKTSYARFVRFVVTLGLTILSL
jgi:hypothetical protein